MSAANKPEFEQAFPVIQEDDPFGGFLSRNPTMNSGDPFASATTATDPFSAFDVTTVSKDAGNPFLADDFSQCPTPSNPTSRTATPIDDVQSVRSDEVPWPGNNTAESTVETSCDSAAVSGSSDAITANHASSSMDTSGSSSSSGSAVPRIALDSDSGNLTADVNENACLPNTIYGLIDSAEGETAIRPAPTQPPIPQILLTEATVLMEKSSQVEFPGNNASIEDGNSRLLDSSEPETSQDRSRSNTTSVSSQDCVAVQADNLSTMNISLVDTSNDGSDSIMDTQPTEPTQAHDFFVQSGSCHGGELGDDSVPQSELADEVAQQELDRRSLTMPKTNRVFTSSPINPRTMSQVEEPNSFLISWERSNREKISSKDAKEKKDIEELKEQAKADLEHWYRDRQAKIEAQHTLHLEHQDVQYSERPGNEEKTIWQRMANLALELNQGHKVDDKRKDTSKMKHLLQLLAIKAPSLKQ